MSKISILQIDPTDWLAEFDVDVSLLEVPILNTGPGTYTAIAGKAGSKVSQFIIGENLNILSIGVRIPHLFVMGTEEPSLFIRAITSALDTIIYGPIEIPYFNAEIPLEKPINLNLEQFAGTPPDDVSIGLTLVGAGDVSMLNVPDVIDGETIPVLPFIKVEHNFSLIP